MKKIITMLISIILLITLSSCTSTNKKFNEVLSAFDALNTNVISEDFNTPFGTKKIVVENYDGKIKISGNYYDSYTSKKFIIIVIWQEDSSSITITEYSGNLWWAQYDHRLCMESYIRKGYLELEEFSASNGKAAFIGDIFLDDVSEFIENKLGVTLR